MLMDLQLYPFPQWLTDLIAKLPLNSRIFVLWYFFCGVPFDVFHCLTWGLAEGEICSNTVFFEFAFQISRLHFLRSRAAGCKIFSAFMEKKVFLFMALRRCTAIFKCSRTERMTQEWSSAPSPGSPFIFVLLFDLVDIGPRAKVLLASGERATFLDLHCGLLPQVSGQC